MLTSFVLLFYLICGFCWPGPVSAGGGDDNCLYCHVQSELLPVGFSPTEEIADTFAGRACPGMARIKHVALLTESSLAELNVVVSQNDLRGSDVDRFLLEAEARYRRLREEPIASRSDFAKDTGELRRQVDSLVLKPMARNVEKHRLLIVLLGGVGFAAVVSVISWRLIVRRSRQKRSGTHSR